MFASNTPTSTSTPSTSSAPATGKQRRASADIALSVIFGAPKAPPYQRPRYASAPEPISLTHRTAPYPRRSALKRPSSECAASPPLSSGARPTPPTMSAAPTPSSGNITAVHFPPVPPPPPPPMPPTLLHALRLRLRLPNPFRSRPRVRVRVCTRRTRGTPTFVAPSPPPLDALELRVCESETDEAAELDSEPEPEAGCEARTVRFLVPPPPAEPKCDDKEEKEEEVAWCDFMNQRTKTPDLPDSEHRSEPMRLDTLFVTIFLGAGLAAAATLPEVAPPDSAQCQTTGSQCFLTNAGACCSGVCCCGGGGGLDGVCPPVSCSVLQLEGVVPGFCGV
ncbi:hypothetical protein B0H15DRAFT_943551 [Mycena belliarum]|uniref:Uncharacterized protein n=1 Tax=Mycena belliarum TaxID=1033014 RepID=A0AAD6UEX2_9AGAR|nr:hypothetical protein B0H15DRAFT_943551 [Mycena belliae]